jgi:alpha-L-rhamnosidase
MVHTFYLWRGADLTARTAGILGRAAEAKEYAELAESTRKAFWNRFYDEQAGTYGPYGGDIFALRMGVPEDQRPRVIEALRSRIEANGGHLDTGIFGTQFFFEVLSENGMHELAFEAMNKKTFPSYGWWIEQGATTTWEHWSGRGSHNHPMFGGGIVWLYRKLAGMSADPEAPGYRHIVFRPQPVADVSFAEYSNETPFGRAGIQWKTEDGRFSMDVEVPVGSSATVFVPAGDPGAVTEGGRRIEDGPNLSYTGVRDGYVVYSVTSGRYSFVADAQ